MYYVWLGRDNALELQLQDAGKTIDHSPITRVEVALVGGDTLDSQASPAWFDLAQADRIGLLFGQSSVTPGRYRARLITYDPDHPNGLVWNENHPMDMVFANA